MLLSYYFAGLNERIGKIKERMAMAQEEEKTKLYHTVLQLRQISDKVVEEWLNFEEQLVEVQRMFENMEDEESCGTSELQSADGETEDVQEIYLPYPLAAQFRRGQGYFMLSMYREAVESFNQVIEEAPDVAVARLYLAFGFFMLGRLDMAYRQFRLLSETCEHAFIRAASYNALGCISAVENNAEQGLLWFEHALAAFPDLTDAAYNQALTLYQLGRYKEAAAVCALFLEKEKDDVEVLLLAGASHAKNKQMEEACRLLRRAEGIARQAKHRKRIACTYEQLERFADAARCYRELLPDYRNDPSVWHGLGWSLWQNGQVEQALSCLKCALTLAPEQPDYACSYAWMLLYEGEHVRAGRIFERIARKYNQPLAWAGMVETLLKQQRIPEAQALVDGLLAAEAGHVRTLGHYLQGRVLLLQGKREEALPHFSASHAAGGIRESGLYAGLLHYTDGAYEEAYERWKEWMPAP